MNPLWTLRNRLGRQATRVAVLAALGICVLCVVLLVASSSRGTYEVNAVFDDVRGLISGGEVRAGAVAVGKVTEVELNSDDEPEVTMAIDDDFALHEGAKANIRLGSNVGAVNRVVELAQGDTSKPKLAQETTLTAKDTDQPVNFDIAAEALDPPTRANLRRLLTGLDNAVKGRGGDIDRTLRHSGAALGETANLLAQVNRDGEALRTLVTEGERVTSALASSPGDLGEAAESTARLLDTTGNRQAELAESTGLMGPALARGRRTVDRLADATPGLRKLVAGLGPVVDELGPFARTVPAATQAAHPLLVETRKLVEGGPRDLRRFEPVIDAATPVATDFPPIAERAGPLAQELRAYVPEALGFFQNFGAAAGSFDATGHVLNLAAGGAQRLPSSTASARIGPADCTPGLLEKPFIRLPGTNECEPWRDFKDSFIEIGGDD